MVSVLIHVEHEDWRRADHGMGVINGDLVVEPTVVGRIAQHDPARPSSQRLGGGDELAPPLADATEVPFERGGNHGRDLAVAADVHEVELVEDDRRYG